MKTIDRAKTTGAEVDKAIADAVRSGETLTITNHGVPTTQIVTPKRPPPCTCGERVVGAVCLDCNGSVDHPLKSSGACEVDVVALIRKLGKCRRCNGDGEFLPSCFRCDDSTDDHECPGPRPCSTCEQTGLMEDAREALALLEEGRTRTR